MVQLVNGFYVNWDKSKIIKGGLAKGKVYATYTDKECTRFSMWMSRKEILHPMYEL
jgi:hypothetical protein